MADSCEWNPIEHRASLTTDDPHADAVWSVGTKTNWHLCEACAALPEFARLTKRVWIGPKQASAAGLHVHVVPMVSL